MSADANRRDGTATAVIVTHGLVIGAVSGGILALGDFGALWLWLSLWGDRALLLLRLLATLVPLGAVLGGCLAVTALAGDRLAARLTPKLRAHTWPAVMVSVGSPLLALVADQLFRGGKMSRLPMRGTLVVVVALGLALGAYVGSRLLRASLERALLQPPSRRRLFGAVALAMQFAVAKVDQTVLPNLYQYLHACLAFAGFLAAGLAVALFASTLPAVSRTLRTRPVLVTAVTGCVVAVVMLTNLATLSGNQNVRVALFDPRASTSRSTMMALEPVLVWHERAQRQARGPARGGRLPGRVDVSRFANLPVAREAHVLLVTIDALRADHVGAYGYGRGLTPNLDRLAAQSVVFERAYSQAPHSSYSLSSLMTSEYLHETTDLGLELPAATLASTLGDAGYESAAFYTLGIFHTEGERLHKYRDDAFGFALHDHTDRPAEEMTDRVLAEVDRAVSRGEPKTVFWVHYFDVHEPYEDRSLGSSDIDRYDGELRNVDRAFGRLLEQMRRRLHAPIVVAVTADHGEEFREHGGVYHGSSVYEEQIRVPFIVSIPGAAPRRVPAPVQLVDMTPTLLGAVGVEPAPSMRGTDLRPLATGAISNVGPAFAAVIHKRMVVAWPYKLVADLRFGLFELYDLEHDPHERQNLADREPARVGELKDHIYAWLDSLSRAPGVQVAADARQVALDRGRLGDRRAVEPLCTLLLDASAPEPMRREAGRILARLADTSSAGALERATRDPNRLVAAEAAIALGRMYDPRARPALLGLVQSEDPDIRVRAAISLGRLRDRAAVPSLIDSLWVAETTYDREEAIRWLGRLRDPRAVEPLLAMLPEFRTRYLVTIALGKIGDPRAYPALADMLTWEFHSDIRECVVTGLGLLGDSRAIPGLSKVAATEPDVDSAGEGLVRLRAIGTGTVGGADLYPDADGLQGFANCFAGAFYHDWDYRFRTYCVSAEPAFSVALAVPPTLAAASSQPSRVTALVSIRRLDAQASAKVRIALGRERHELDVDGAIHELRIPLQTPLTAGTLRAELTAQDPAARFALDHVLLVASPAS